MTRIVAAAFTAAVTLLATATPALAGGAWNGGGPGDSGRPGSGGSIASPGGDGFSCGSNISANLIATALYHKEGGKWVMWDYGPYPNCTPGSGGGWITDTPGFWRCITGFEVYRFYGKDETSPPSAITRSRLNVPDTCDSGTGTTYSVAAQTVWDASPGRSPGMPDYQATGTNAVRAANGLEAAVGGREGPYGSLLLTSGQPTIVTGSCTAVSHPNPIMQQWNGQPKAWKTAMRAALGTMYIKASADGAMPKTGANAAGLETISGYYFDDATYRAQIASGKKSGEDPPDNAGRKTGNYYAKTFTWETSPCATPWNFADLQDLTTGVTYGSRAMYGSCIIPLTTPGDRKTKNGVARWAFPALGQGYGERYSSYYAQIGDTGVSAPAWRQAMYQDYLTRAGAGVVNGAGVQTLPLQPYANESAPGVSYDPSTADTAAAAAALKNDAVCFRGAIGESTHSTTGTSTPPGGQPGPGNPNGDQGGAGNVVAEPAGEMQLHATTPQVLQTGGGAYRATFNVSSDPSQLHCNQSTTCTLVALSYTVNISATGGYRQCAAGQISGCDYRIVRKTQGGLGRDAQIVAEFYNATMPAAAVKITVAGLSGRYMYQVRVPGYTISIVNPLTGKKITQVIAPSWRTAYRSFMPTVTGSPKQFSKSGGTYTVSYPVIAATAQPGR